MAISTCNTITDQNNKELIKHGTFAFPIACYCDDLKANPVPWHWHDEVEAAIVTEGQALVITNNMKLVLSEGEGFFFNANVLHAVRTIDTSSCCLHSIVFHPRLVGGNTDSIFWQKYVAPLITNASAKMFCFHTNTSWQKEILVILEQIWNDCVFESFGYELTVRSNLSNLFFNLLSQVPSSTKVPSAKELRDNKRIKEMLQFIQEHFSESLSNADIARSIMVSTSECLRCFHHTIDMTPMQYVKQYRIQKAAELLVTTNQKISDIGISCGFQEASYFGKVFHEIYNCTPSAYRMRYSSFYC